MLAKRIITAVIGMVIAVYVINYGQWVYGAAVIILSVAGWHEFCLMMRQKQTRIAYWLGCFGIILLLGCSWLGNTNQWMAVLCSVTALVLINLVISKGKFQVTDAAFTLFGVSYVGFPFAYLLLLRFMPSDKLLTVSGDGMSAGTICLWLAFIGTWASDTFAFFIGSAFGRHKLCPSVSPKKTVEGFCGGLAGSMIGIGAAGYLFHFPLFHALGLGVIVGIAAPVGDLAESVIKRYAGVKDSGRLLPGHGGVLDRFDSLMFAVPAVYYYMILFFQA